MRSVYNHFGNHQTKIYQQGDNNKTRQNFFNLQAAVLQDGGNRRRQKDKDENEIKEVPDQNPALFYHYVFLRVKSLAGQRKLNADVKKFAGEPGQPDSGPHNHNIKSLGESEKNAVP